MELRPVLAAVGGWGQRWARNIRDEDLDPGWLVWAMHRRLNTAVMPRGRTVIEIEFVDTPRHQRRFWLVCAEGNVDVCLKPPGFDVDLNVTTGVRVLAEVWRGLRPLGAEIRSGRIRVAGMTKLRRSVSPLAVTERLRIDRQTSRVVRKAHWTRARIVRGTPGCTT